MPNIVTMSNIYIITMPKCNRTNQPTRCYIISKLLLSGFLNTVRLSESLAQKYAS